MGKISEINAQMIEPEPIACEAINKNTKNGKMAVGMVSPKKETDIRASEIIYPMQPMYKSFFLPNLSINDNPTIVNIKLMTPTPIVESKLFSALILAISKIRGAKYIMAFIPDN